MKPPKANNRDAHAEEPQVLEELSSSDCAEIQFAGEALVKETLERLDEKLQAGRRYLADN
ncbi:hypothetical protein KDL44_09530 [bacterium]|nr:hypothetical protein [bacterium]